MIFNSPHKAAMAKRLRARISNASPVVAAQVSTAPSSVPSGIYA